MVVKSAPLHFMKILNPKPYHSELSILYPHGIGTKVRGVAARLRSLQVHSGKGQVCERLCNIGSKVLSLGFRGLGLGV